MKKENLYAVLLAFDVGDEGDIRFVKAESPAKALCKVMSSKFGFDMSDSKDIKTVEQFRNNYDDVLSIVAKVPEKEKKVK